MVLARFQALEPSDTPANPSPIALYVRADGPDAAELYKRLMRRLTKSRLTELAKQSLVPYAEEELRDARGLSEAPELDKEIERLRRNPELVLEAIRSHELAETGVLSRQQRDTSRVEARSSSFERAVRGILNPNASDLACDWLAGEVLADADLERLGVTGNIDSAQDVLLGVRVVAILARRARTALVITVDQVENFLESGQGLRESGNLGMLQGLLEAVTAEGGYFVAAITESTWRDLPLYVKQRFGLAEIRLEALSPNEAARLVRAYLSPWSSSGADDLYPFDKGAVREILVDSGGNTRRFIQSCSVVFEAAAPEQSAIGRRFDKRQLARQGGEHSPDLPSVHRVVERALLKASWGTGTIEQRSEIGGRYADYALCRGDQPVVVVQITEALFAEAEAREALEDVRTIRAIRQRRPAVVLVVVVGYSSPEVIRALEGSADRVLVARDSRFESDVER